MTRHRLTAIAALIAASALLLTGCSILEPTPLATPSPTPTVIDTTTYIGETVDPANTTWVGHDSGGDDTRITLHDNGTVAISYGANTYDDPNDTWKVIDGVLHIDVYLDETEGHAKYTGTWNSETTALDTVIVTTVSNRTLTVTLTQQ